MSSNKKRDLFQTKVALVCLKTHQNNNQITNQALVQIFSKYGSIQKILIFERGAMLTKVFIEYEETDSVSQAIKFLNNSKLFDSVPCNVYYSRLQQLKLDNIPYTKGVDLTQPKQPTNPKKKQEDQELKLLSEWEDFQFDNNSTEDLSSEDETKQEFSEEKLLDIRNKLNQIDDEIHQAIESKISRALNKLQQNTRCIQIILDNDQMMNNEQVSYIFQIFGKISYLKFNKNIVYIKFDNESDCQRAYQALKNYLNISIMFNFEKVPGTLQQPICLQSLKIAQTLKNNSLIPIIQTFTKNNDIISKDCLVDSPYDFIKIEKQQGIIFSL